MLQCFARGSREAELYAAIAKRLRAAVGEISVKHDRTQTAFVRRVQFAWVSMPRRRADAGAVMLSFGLPSPVESGRILHRAQVAPGRWMHHMLIRDEEEMDDEVLGWLTAAWAFVGPGRR